MSKTGGSFDLTNRSFDLITFPRQEQSQAHEASSDH